MDTQIKITPKIDSSENEFYNVLSHFSESEIQFLTDKIQEKMESENEKTIKIHFSIFGKDNESTLNIRVGTYSENTFFSTIDTGFVSLRLHDVVVEYPSFTTYRQGFATKNKVKNYLELFNK